MRTLGLLWLAMAVSASAQVRFEGPKDGTITVVIAGKPFTTMYFGPDAPKPYLHPLRAASGTVVTRQYPMEQVAGESRDHQHHRGLWFSHGDVNGTDFWANESNYKTANRGQIIFDNFLNTSTTAKSGTIAAHFVWMNQNQKPLLKENRVMTFYDEPNRRTIDFDITLTALTPVTFGDTKEGTFAIRLADALAENNGGLMTNAQGATTMAKVWGRPSEWVDYAGAIKGEKLGITIFDHPGNPHHPTTWHSRDYGLFAANPFGLHDFTHDPKANGSLSLQANGTVRFRYRVVIHAGGTDMKALAAEYKKYAGER